MGRFQTTMAADLERVTSRLHEVDDRRTVCEKLRERKLANTQASVVFGFDPMVYETDYMSRQNDALNKGEKGMKVDGKAMKKTLTATHFVLGNDRSTWTTTSTMLDPTGHVHEYKGTLAKQDPKKSSCYFGSDALTRAGGAGL